MDLRGLTASFRETFDAEPRLFRAPGRVNLIGEHTDYNDGYVLPMAIERDTVIAAAPRADRTVRVSSKMSGETAEFRLDDLSTGGRGIWLDYVEGVARALTGSGVTLAGADLMIESDVPVGAGLSSSAALELSTGLALVTLANAAIDPVALALAGQKAEHESVGTQCGIMDQMTAALGRRGHALLIDCRSLETELISMDLADADVVICDSRIKHSLASSEYNVRRAECREGVRLLAESLPGITALRDVSFEQFAERAGTLPETIRRRCLHVVTENARTLAAADAFRAGDLPRAGKLMIRSHESLRDDYQVSCAELDTLVEIATGTDGVLGARMTGGGFGGCTVNLVARSARARFEERIADEYRKATGIDVAIFVSGAGEGASEIAS